MVEIKKCINVYSELNPWIDFYVVINNEKEFGEAYVVVDRAYDEWNETDNCEPVADYISGKLTERGIKHEVYFKDEEEEQ